MGSALKVGVIGVGKISSQYFESFPALPGLELIAVADLDESRAANTAREQGVESLAVHEMLEDPRVDAILNLTTPEAHAEIALKALAAGKHVYAEKPLALAPDEAQGMLLLAARSGKRLGSAPDTVLGTGIQTARHLLDSGAIGDAVGATAFWSSPGHERWHPAPHFYYQPGAGPLFDMGPYYLSALVTLLGPVARVSGATGRSTRPRFVGTGPRAGEAVPVDVDTHVTAILEHRSGVSSSITVTFDVWASRIPHIEVYGTAGTIAVPDPNRFSEPVEVWTSDDPSWRLVPPLAGYANASRGFGLADMAHAVATERPHRASAELAFHVLEIMDAVLRAGASTSVIHLSSSPARPEPVPLGTQPNSW